MAFSCQSPKSPPWVSFGWTGPSIRGLYLALLLSLLWQDCCLPANRCYLLQPQYFYDATDPSSGELICDWGKMECCRLLCFKSFCRRWFLVTIQIDFQQSWPISETHTNSNVWCAFKRTQEQEHSSWQLTTPHTIGPSFSCANLKHIQCELWLETRQSQTRKHKHKHKLWLETLWARPETPQDLSHASRLCGDSLAEDASNDMYRHQHPIQNEEENMEQDILQLHSNSN